MDIGWSQTNNNSNTSLVLLKSREVDLVKDEKRYT